MTEASSNNDNGFRNKIDGKLRRKIRSQKRDKKSAWSGLGLFGIVGWSVMIPTLLGTLLGIWMDKKVPQTFSWTITMLTAGLLTGCIVAWRWIEKENKEMNQNNESDD